MSSSARTRTGDRDDSVFDDPLMTPPTTNAKTGTWDDEGPIRGWSIRPDRPGSTVLDLVLEKQWTVSGLTCLLLRITEYFERGRHTQESPDYGEGETYYRGYVHAPDVESFPKGYGRTYIVDCYPDDGWFCWDERSFSNGHRYGESKQEAARRKTRQLAGGLAKRKRGEL